jgi:hypothetical protein
MAIMIAMAKGKGERLIVADVEYPTDEYPMSKW